MRTSTTLALIDNAQIAAPEFRRGCAWNRDQRAGSSIRFTGGIRSVHRLCGEPPRKDQADSMDRSERTDLTTSLTRKEGWHEE